MFIESTVYENNITTRMSQFCTSKCGKLGLYLGQEAVLF